MLDMTESIGDRLKELRGEMTQPAFGAIAGASKQHVSRIEKGLIREPSPAWLAKWAAHFGVRMEWLATGKSPKLSAGSTSVSQPERLDWERIANLTTTVVGTLQDSGVILSSDEIKEMIQATYDAFSSNDDSGADTVREWLDSWLAAKKGARRVRQRKTGNLGKDGDGKAAKPAKAAKRAASHK